MKWTEGATGRCGNKATELRLFMNNLRETPGISDLYPTGEPTEAERFHTPPVGRSDGRIPPHPSAP